MIDEKVKTLKRVNEKITELVPEDELKEILCADREFIES